MLGAAEGSVTGHLRAAVPRPPHSHAAHRPCQLPEPVTCLVLQKVILLHELPVGLQSLGSTGQVEGIRVSVQQVLERLQGGLAGLEGEEPGLSIWVFSFSSLPSHPHPLSPLGAGRRVNQSWLFLRTPSTVARADVRAPAGHVSRQQGLPTSAVFPWSGPFPAPRPYRSHFAQQLFLSLAKQGLALDGSNGFWVQLSHGLAGQPGGRGEKEGRVEARVSSNLGFLQVFEIQN